MMKKISWVKDFLFKNTTTQQTIAKNTFWLFVGQMVSRFLRAGIVIYAARTLGIAGWGAFSYALGVATFLTTFSDIGINALITKEASRDTEKRDRYIATALILKLVLLLALCVLVFMLFPYLTNIEEAAAIMPILIFVFAFDTLRDLGSAISRALERMEIESLIQIFTNAVIVALGFIFLIHTPTSTSLAYAYAIGSGIGFVVNAYVLRHYFKNILENFKTTIIPEILRLAWPFGLMGVLGIMMLNTDIIMLGWLKGPSEVGFYSIAQKLIQLLYVIPTFFASSIFPAMSRTVRDNLPAFKNTLEKNISAVILIALPIVIFGIGMAHIIIEKIFGAMYVPSVPVFQILLFTVIMVYPSLLASNALFAADRQRVFMKFVAVGALSNIIFNAIFIPSLGAVGAAISTIVAQIITNFLIWRELKSLIPLTIATTCVALIKQTLRFVLRRGTF